MSVTLVLYKSPPRNSAFPPPACAAGAPVGRGKREAEDNASKETEAKVHQQARASYPVNAIESRRGKLVVW